MASPSPPSLTILETSQISPSPSPSPSPSAPGTPISLPLTFFDIFWLYSPPVERLFFYEFPASSAAAAFFLPALKSSLSIALRSFFPLAGRLRLSPDAADRYEIFCSPRDSVPLAFAELAGGDFDELSSGRPRDNARLRPLVPELAHGPDDSQALLAIQATVIPPRGAVIGVTVHHAACDGLTSTRFVKTWAAACRAILNPGAVPPPPPPPPPPIVDRTVISDPRGLYAAFYHDLLSPDHFAPNETPAAAAAAAPDGVLLASFDLTSAHIRAIKKAIAASPAAPANPSTIVAAYAFVWTGRARAARRSSGGGGGRRMYLLFPADFRRRVEPPIPGEYFGNCIGPCIAEAEAEELLGGGGLAAAAAAIARGIGELNSGLDGAGSWTRRIKAVVREQGLSAAGSPRFGVYDADFGWGRPRRVDIVSVAKTGAVALAEGREEDGPGGVQIGLGLRQQELEYFQNYFVQGLRDLADDDFTI